MFYKISWYLKMKKLHIQACVLPDKGWHLWLESKDRLFAVSVCLSNKGNNPRMDIAPMQHHLICPPPSHRLSKNVLPPIPSLPPISFFLCAKQLRLAQRMRSPGALRPACSQRWSQCVSAYTGVQLGAPTLVLPALRWCYRVVLAQRSARDCTPSP